MEPLSDISAPNKVRIQTGFPARLTSTYVTTTGYSWEMLVLTDSTTPSVTQISNPPTGNRAFTPDNNQSLTSGTEGWMEPDPLGRGWIFLQTTAAASGLQVEDVDESPSVSSVTQLRFDSADGFTVSSPGAGIARVDQTAASASAVGYVTLADQVLGNGRKTIASIELHSAGAGYCIFAAGNGGTAGAWSSNPGSGAGPFDPATADATMYAQDWIANASISGATVVATTAFYLGPSVGVSGTVLPNAVSSGGIVTSLGAKESAVTSLTDSTGGTANDTVAAVSGTGDDATINNNFADLAAKVNTILSRLRSASVIST